jgi:hypothetical protein
MRWTVLLFLGCSVSPALGATRVVHPDGSGDWPTIQAAISASQPGDVVELTDGTFRGDGNRDLDFRGRALTIRSQSGVACACIIDCEGTESNQHRGFNCFSGEGPGSIVQGVTITGGLEAGC